LPLDTSVNRNYIPAQPAPSQGDATRSSRNVGAGCDGRCGVRQDHSRRTKAPQRTAKSCGPGAATLALPAGACSRTTGARKAASPGRARISRKTIARGKPGCPGCTCGLTRVHFCSTLRTRDCGRSRRPAFPAPSIQGGATNWQHSGEKPAARMSSHVFVIARSDSDEAIHLSACRAVDCFASLAMTDEERPPCPLMVRSAKRVLRTMLAHRRANHEAQGPSLETAAFAASSG
jgi:hypothetical protein